MADIITKLKNLNLENEDTVTLVYEDGADVFHFNETEIETALSETDVVEQLAELITTPGLDAKDSWGGGSILQSLRDKELLDGNERGTGDFTEFLTEQINENFYDTEVIDYSTEKYDHKRGYTTLTATVKVSAGNLIQSNPTLFGWKASVQTDNGLLVID